MFGRRRCGAGGTAETGAGSGTGAAVGVMDGRTESEKSGQNLPQVNESDNQTFPAFKLRKEE
jgi:hypothetical protein